jgi:hypothetical protein
MYVTTFRVINVSIRFVVYHLRFKIVCFRGKLKYILMLYGIR